MWALPKLSYRIPNNTMVLHIIWLFWNLLDCRNREPETGFRLYCFILSWLDAHIVLHSTLLHSTGLDVQNTLHWSPCFDGDISIPKQLLRGINWVLSGAYVELACHDHNQSYWKEFRRNWFISCLQFLIILS